MKFFSLNYEYIEEVLDVGMRNKETNQHESEEPGLIQFTKSPMKRSFH